MPNPFLSTRRNQSHEDMTNQHPQPVEPAIEHIDARDGMNPYRGLDVHGVRSPFHADISPDQISLPIIDYESEAKEILPIPVHVVNLGPREFQRWRVARQYATGAPARIVSQNMARTRLHIRNIGSQPIWLGTDSSVSAVNGYPLAVPPTFGCEIDLTIQAEVWAVSDDGSQQPIALYSEYAQPLT